MTHNIGRFLIGEGDIPAGSDAQVLFRVFTAGEKPVQIEFVQYYGGDAGEFAQLILIPPNVLATGLKPSDTSGTIAICSMGYLQGAFAVEDGPAALGSDNGGRGNPRFTPFVIPPFSSIAIMQNTANTAVWSCTIGGFELNG
jgi:hypothetical protein